MNTSVLSKLKARLSDEGTTNRELNSCVGSSEQKQASPREETKQTPKRNMLDMVAKGLKKSTHSAKVS
jgi:hypothetical protein